MKISCDANEIIKQDPNLERTENQVIKRTLSALRFDLPFLVSAFSASTLPSSSSLFILLVSKYASQYYKKATPYYGEFPFQFFPSEMIPCTRLIESVKHDKHSIIIYPEQITITDIEVDHIPHIIKICMDDKILESTFFQNDSRISKLEGINIYLFCDVTTMDRIITLYQWFDHCFFRNNYKNVNYIFVTGNLKNDQTSSIMIHNGRHHKILSQYITLREVDTFVRHFIDTQ